MYNLKFHKQERLCSRTATNELFAQGHSVMAYPLRAVYLATPEVAADRSKPRIMISIPKKRIRHAVQRVLLRRRTREAYRLHRRELLWPALLQSVQRVDVAFVYVSKDVASYVTIEKKMRQLLTAIARDITAPDPS